MSSLSVLCHFNLPLIACKSNVTMLWRRIITLSVLEFFAVGNYASYCFFMLSGATSTTNKMHILTFRSYFCAFSLGSIFHKLLYTTTPIVFRVTGFYFVLQTHPTTVSLKCDSCTSDRKFAHQASFRFAITHDTLALG